ncbi:MAG: alpha/beta hydrolase [Mycobacteriales bacterium]
MIAQSGDGAFLAGSTFPNQHNNSVYRRSRFFVLGALALVVAMLLSMCSLNVWNKPEELGSITQLDGTATPWRNCADRAHDIAHSDVVGVTFSCATLRVPQNWAQEHGQMFSLALLRMRSAAQTRRIGSLVVNPGGPGASGVEFAAQSALFLPKQLQQRFDIVGFDPRGVGGSSPVRCISDKQKDKQAEENSDPDAAELATQLAQAAAIARQCSNKYGTTLQYISTEQTARDMDAIRRAVGDTKLNYLGYSYGTLLGAVYARLFGGNIATMVLDGAVDPQQDSVTASERQAAGFEKEFDAFAANCQQRGDRCPLGVDARATTARIISKVAQQPVKAPGGRHATEGVAVFAALAAMYSPEKWSALENALHDLDAGKPAGVFSLIDEYNGRGSNGHYDNSVEANLAIGCADERNPVPVAEVTELQTQWRSRYPLFGSALAVTLLGCASWKSPRDEYPVGAATSAPPIVVVGTTGDPATPYENTARLATLLGTGTVLTWEGQGHTAYPQTSCITDAVNRYLIEKTVPDPGTHCR